MPVWYIPLRHKHTAVGKYRCRGLRLLHSEWTVHPPAYQCGHNFFSRPPGQWLPSVQCPWNRAPPPPPVFVPEAPCLCPRNGLMGATCKVYWLRFGWSHESRKTKPCKRFGVDSPRKTALQVHGVDRLILWGRIVSMTQSPFNREGHSRTKLRSSNCKWKYEGNEDR